MSSRRRSTSPRASGGAEDLSFRDRADGPNPDDIGRVGRRRITHPAPRTQPDHRLAAWLFRCPALHELAESFEPARRGPGRPLDVDPVAVVVFEILTAVNGSERDVVLRHADPVLWDHYQVTVQAAFPDRPNRWLGNAGPSRSQLAYWRRTRLGTIDRIDAFRARCTDIAVDVANLIGIGGHYHGDITHPRTTQVFVGDATYLRGMFNTAADDAIDTETGEIRTRRVDPDAVKIQQDRGRPGYRMTHIDARTPYTREQVVFDLDVTPGQRGSDATAFTDMALSLLPTMPGMRAAAYDGALYPTDIDRFLTAGIIPINHPQYTAKGVAVRLNIGEHTFTTTTGSKTPMVVTAVDGTPCITIATAEGRHEIGLCRYQTKIRPNADGSHTVGGHWKIPDEPIVPVHLRSAVVWIHHNSTPDDLARKKPRTRALRPIPASDPDFAKLYGVRNDTESKHHVMKRVLPNKRLNVVGLQRVRLRMHGWQLAVTLGAAVAWHERTGGDLGHLFAQPPPFTQAA